MNLFSIHFYTIRKIVFFSTGFMFLCFSCKKNNENYIDIFISNLPNDSILEIQTFDGSNQVVHPDICFRNDSAFFSITPYPFYNDKLENPCIYHSPNGLDFNELSKWKNPLADTPYKDHNSDADIHIDQNNKIKIIYLESLRPELNKVIELSEVDTGFVKKELIIHDLLNNDPFILSPAFVRKNEKELLYFVNMTQKKVQYINLTQKTKINEININLPNNYSPWHVDILSYNNKLYLLTNGYYGNQQDGKYNLLISESTDGVTWNNTREILNENQVIDKELKYIYRSTFIMNEEYIVLWYSYVRKNDTWRVALKKIKLK